MLQMTKMKKSQEFLQLVANEIKLRMLKIPEDDVKQKKKENICEANRKTRPKFKTF